MTPGKTNMDVAIVTLLFAIPTVYAIDYGWYLVAIALAVAGLVVVHYLPDIHQRLA